MSERRRRCALCGWLLAYHRIGDDACPITDPEDASLEFHRTERFVSEQEESSNDQA